MWQEFLGWLMRVGHGTLSFISTLAESIADNGGQVLIDAAKQEVQAVEDAAAAGLAAGNIMTAEDKFAQAQAAVVQTLKTEGIPVVMNAVNGAIEAAVAAMRAAAAPALPAVPVNAPTTDPAQPQPVAATPAAGG